MPYRPTPVLLVSTSPQDLQEQLRGMDIVITVVCTAPGIIEEIEDNQMISVVIFDADALPRQTFAFSRWVRRNRPRMRIIICSNDDAGLPEKYKNAFPGEELRMVTGYVCTEQYLREMLTQVLRVN